MTKEEFIENLKEELEIESNIDEGTVLQDLEEWASLSQMVVIGFAKNQFGVKLTGDDVESLTTIKSLMDKLGL